MCSSYFQTFFIFPWEPEGPFGSVSSYHLKLCRVGMFTARFNGPLKRLTCLCGSIFLSVTVDKIKRELLRLILSEGSYFSPSSK